MSKFLKVLIVMLTIAAFAAPVMAADNFSVSGNMWVYGIHTNADAASGASTTTAKQKLRVQGTFKANDMVSATFRTDFVEGFWGTDSAVGRLGAINDFDRAYLDIKLDAVDLRAGTQYVAFGKSGAFILNDTAISAKIKGEMPITVVYSLADDNDSALTGQFNEDTGLPEVEAATSGADTHVFGVNVDLKAFSVFGGLQTNADSAIYLFGATYQAKYDNIGVVAEFDFFTGDATDTADATGMQGFIDASMAVSDTLTAGGAFYYAAGNDDATDMKYTQIGVPFGAWDPMTRGPFADENYLVATRPYDLFADGGIMAIQVYADMKVSDALKGGASLAYALPAEDSEAEIDSRIITSVFAQYSLTANASFNSGIQYVINDHETVTDNDSDLSIMSGLNVTF